LTVNEEAHKASSQPFGGAMKNEKFKVVYEGKKGNVYITTIDAKDAKNASDTVLTAVKGARRIVAVLAQDTGN